jgi:hypothetical protein
MSRFVSFATLFAGAVLSRAALAQTSSIAGTVVRDSSGTGLGEVEVAIPAANRRVRTNYAGEFRVDGLTAGAHVVVFRRLGFNVRTDTITLQTGQVVDGEYLLTETPTTLAGQQIVAAKDAQSFVLREFDERMKTSVGGRFITDSMLRKDADNHNFMNFIQGRLPGMRTIRGTGGREWLASGRKAGCSLPAFQCTGGAPCYVSVYIDGQANYVSGVTQGGDPTNFAELKSEDFAAIEYYASGATAPSQYNQTGSDCGVLLLWHRSR